MKKTIVSLICTLALCLGLLPTAALAADEPFSKLYVGKQLVMSGGQVTYWTTDSSGALTQSNENAAWNVKYDPGTTTLTLNGATIDGGDYNATYYGAGIYALSLSGQPVSLTIELIGKNTITGYYGIYLDGHQGNIKCTDASVLIKNGNDSGESGSLTVNGTSSNGISIISGTGNASLTIENASVVASTAASYHSGVCVQSGASSQNSPRLSLAVNGGSLTASGVTNSDGIQFYVGSPDATNATTSLTVSGNAIVDARTGGIRATRGSTELPTPTPTGENSTGIVWNGKSGTVYGDVTLQDDLTVDKDETLTIPKGSSLTVPTGKTLTNDGTVTTSGTLTNEGTLENTGTVTVENGGTLTNSSTGTVANDGTVTTSGTLTNKGDLENTGTVTIENGGTLTGGDDITNTGTINVEKGGSLEGTPTGGTVVTAPVITTTGSALPDGTAGQPYTATLAATGNNITWSASGLPAGLTLNSATGTITGTPTAAGSSTVTVKAENSAGSTENTFTLNIKPATVSVTGVKLDKTTLALFVGNSGTLKATVEPADATNPAVTWSTSNAAIATVDQTGKVTAVAPGTATITVTTQDGAKTATCAVTVTAKTYSMSIDPGAIGFGNVQVGYTQPAVKEVVVKNTGNQTLTLTQPTANNYQVGSLNQFTVAPGDTAIFTVQPKAGLLTGTYNETVVVAASGAQSVSVSLTFSVGSPVTSGTAVTEKRTLHFDTNGGLAMADVVRGLGAPVELWPYTPVRAGYLFQGWYSDQALTKAVSSVVLTKDTTIYAKWAVDPAAAAAQSSSSGSGSSGKGSGSGSSGKGSGSTTVTVTPSPTVTPTPAPTATPTPEPTATPEASAEPETDANAASFPVVPVAAGVIVLVVLVGGIVIFRRFRD